MSDVAARYRRGLAWIGLRAGDGVVAGLPPGPELMALVLACWESGLHLRLAVTRRAAAGGRDDGFAPKLIVAEPAAVPERPVGADWPDGHAPIGGGPSEVKLSKVGLVEMTPDELGQDELGRGGIEPVDALAQAVLSGLGEGGIVAMGAAALLRSVENFRAVQPVEAGQTLVSGSSPLTLEGAFISIIVPLALGLHVVVGDGAAGPMAFGSALERAALCELAAVDWVRPEWAAWASSAAGGGQALLCGSGWLPAGEAVRVRDGAGDRLGRVVRRGFGTAEAGLWAVVLGEARSAGAALGEARYVAAVRPLRSPLRLQRGEGAGQAGEIVLRPAAEAGGEQQTGAVGWIDAQGGMEVAGRLSDVVVRGRQAALLTEVDCCLLAHPAVRASRTFREVGALPTEKAVCVCVVGTDRAEAGGPEAGGADEAGLRAWLREQGGGVVVPDRFLVLEPEECPVLPEVAVLRAVATGQAGQAVVKSLTARRFRRNPAYDEAGLAAAAERALLTGTPLEFLLFWGCGPRRHAAGPDRAAVEALGELLAATGVAQARAHVICTDLHATNNGHSEAHFLSYFGEVAALARELPISFELESAVWRRGGLSRAQVVALEGKPEFAARWERFPLQARFIQQAGRHSRMIDKAAAARHYYATCLLERVVLRSLFAGSVFLTYNGPEFNECFPDLPTLYVYPGPRGRNDKPWFVDTGEEGGEMEGGTTLQVEAA